jgi:HlyD family secretion protein
VPALAYYVPKIAHNEKEHAEGVAISAPSENRPGRSVGALGTLEPKSRIIRLSAPTSLEGARIERLMVEEGDSISKGAVIGVLDTADRRKGAVGEAEANLVLAEAKLKQVRAGSKQGDIDAQEAQLVRARSELRNAEIELRRAESLKAKQAISSGEFDQRTLAHETAQAEVKRAESLLDSVCEVRKVDIIRAEAEVAAARAAVESARADFEATQLRAPIDAKVLKIVARTGERVAAESGVMEIGDTSEMNAVAEVYEADMPLVAIGQSARVVLPSTGAAYEGKVVEIGHRIGRKVILDNDPVADTDARVVEVRIRIESGKGRELSGLSNARVRVVIDTAPAGESLR